MWFAMIELCMTLLIYWISHDLHYWTWGEFGMAFSNPVRAEQIYHQWILLRISELALALGCIALFTYGGTKRWPLLFLIVLGGAVIAIWILWFYQPVWTPPTHQSGQVDWHLFFSQLA
jgi:hypothetical protein